MRGFPPGKSDQSTRENTFRYRKWGDSKKHLGPCSLLQATNSAHKHRIHQFSHHGLSRTTRYVSTTVLWKIATKINKQKIELKGKGNNEDFTVNVLKDTAPKQVRNAVFKKKKKHQRTWAICYKLKMRYQRKKKNPATTMRLFPQKHVEE